MYRLLIDTCVWIELAKDAKQEHLVEAIAEMQRQGKLSLLVPQLVLEELERSRERVAREHSKSLASHFQVVKGAIERFATTERQKSSIQSELDSIVAAIPVAATADIVMGRIEKLLSSFEVIEASDSVLITAAYRALERRAPFHHDKNSIADAVLIETFAECLHKEPSPDVIFGFVTHNTLDFSREHGNEKLPHPDLSDIFDSAR